VPRAVGGQPSLLDWPDIFERLSHDRDDFQAYVALERRIHAWARHDLGQRGWHVIDDVLMDTCAAVLVNFPDARGPQTFDGFVAGMYKNARRSVLRSLKPSDPIEGLEVAQDELPAPEPDEIELLRRCLEGLSTTHRTAVTMAFLDDAGGREIAAKLDVSHAYARVILWEAKRLLVACGKNLWPLGRH
jgi:DNA-directed RNA polymerase specialized sigma24 family protein